MKKLVSGMVWGSVLFNIIVNIYAWLIVTDKSPIIEVLAIMNMGAFFVFIAGLWLTLKLHDRDFPENSVEQ
ncbi:hypothetical protein [uncultured Sulfitobacter sp.]|uniref:hypothetical protein n=1 Tax=uncultured Sulfitobacter sp. TaxID=191468 RepID=UPI002593220D|nr:hypothetical protein [uncultured Sulfitobacter sp.]